MSWEWEKKKSVESGRSAISFVDTAVRQVEKTSLLDVGKKIRAFLQIGTKMAGLMALKIKDAAWPLKGSFEVQLFGFLPQ